MRTPLEVAVPARRAWPRGAWSRSLGALTSGFALHAAGCSPTPVELGPPPLSIGEMAGVAALGLPLEDDPDEQRRPIVQGTGARMTPQPSLRAAVPLPAPPWTPGDAPTTVRTADVGPLGHDPQVAVGERFLIVYTAHRYRLFDKATGAPLAPAGDGSVPSAGDFDTLFLPVWAARDAEGRPNPQNLNTRLRFTASDPLACDPEAPRDSRACVQELYDTRILWDGRRKRFWVESAARNHLWQCKPGDPCTDEKLSRTQARRYIAVAVSKAEDPRLGFHTYVLVEEYADWPKIGLHERYLVLGHRSSPKAYVFDADRLAEGNPGGGPVRLATLDARRFPGARFLAPVVHHGDTRGVTWLLGSDGSERVVPFALVDTGGERAPKPVLVPGAPVTTGAPLGTLEGAAVYRDGTLSWGFERGAAEKGRQIHLFRMPVRLARGPRGPTAWASAEPRAGYREVVLGGREPDDAEGDVLDYQKPALDVNGAGDTVVVFARKGARTPPEVRYAVVPKDEGRARPAALLRRGTTSAVPDIDDNGKSGIDLAYAQVDPSDDRTVWVTHAFADAKAKWWKQVVAEIRP